MESLESETRRKTNAKNKFLTALVVGALATGCTVYTASATTTTTADGYTAYYGSDIGDSVTGDSTNNYKIQIGLTGTSPASSSSNLYVSGSTTPDDNNTISGAAVRVVEGTYGGTQHPWGISTASIYGGNSYDDDIVTNNTVLVNGTANITGSIYGGFSYVGDVTNNTVTIDDAAVITLSKDNVIVGGETYGGNADNNTVTINGGTITGPTTTSSHDLTGIIGGAAFSETTGALNNTINLNGGTISGIDLYGGYVAYQNTEETNSTGNTVNVAAANSFSFNKIAYVQNLNFILPSSIQSGDTMLTTNTLELNGDLTVATTLNAQAASNFKAGDVVHLLAASTITNNGYSINLANTTFALPRVSRDLLGTVAQNGNDIDLTVAYASDSLNSDTKSFAETALTSAALINDGANRLADTVGATAASALHDQNSQAAVFASTGYGDLRYNTGSHIDSNAWYGTLGVASEMKNSHGTFLYAPFLEYGHTNYDSYLNDGLHGSGDAKYFGLGLWLKQTNTNGTYFEGSLRGGKTTGNYTSKDFLSGTTTVNYDYGAHYYGFSTLAWAM